MKMILTQIEIRQARMLMALPMRYTDIWIKMEKAKPSVQMKTLTDLPYDKLSLKSKTQQSRKFNIQRKKPITATLNHNVDGNSSTPQHRYCPQAANSWCKWQQDKAMGSKTYKA